MLIHIITLPETVLTQKAESSSIKNDLIILENEGR